MYGHSPCECRRVRFLSCVQGQGFKSIIVLIHVKIPLNLVDIPRYMNALLLKPVHAFACCCMIEDEFQRVIFTDGVLRRCVRHAVNV